MAIQIGGHSYDIVSINGDKIECCDRDVKITIGDSLGGAIVCMHWADEFGLWRASVERTADTVPIPWPIAIAGGELPYSIEVTVDCPDDTPIAWTVEEVW